MAIGTKSSIILITVLFVMLNLLLSEPIHYNNMSDGQKVTCIIRFFPPCLSGSRYIFFSSWADAFAESARCVILFRAGDVFPLAHPSYVLFPWLCHCVPRIFFSLGQMVKGNSCSLPRSNSVGSMSGQVVGESLVLKADLLQMSVWKVCALRFYPYLCPVKMLRSILLVVFQRWTWHLSRPDVRHLSPDVWLIDVINYCGTKGRIEF